MPQAWPAASSHQVLLNKYYVDEAYEGAFIRPGYRAVATRALEVASTPA